MTIEELLQFIKTQKITYMASIEKTEAGDKARVRPMSALTEIDGKLTWCTNNQKETFKEVISNSNIEFCMYEAGRTVRVSGVCTPTKDESIKAKFLELQPGTAKFYGGQEDTFEVLVFETAEAFISKGSEKETIKIY